MKVCTNETYVLHTRINFCIFMKHYVRSKINDQTSRSQQYIPNSSINEWSNSIFQDNLLKLLIINVMSITNTAVTGLLLKYRINSLFLIHSVKGSSASLAIYKYFALHFPSRSEPSNHRWISLILLCITQTG